MVIWRSKSTQMVYQYNLLIWVVCINHFVHLSANIFLHATRILTKKTPKFWCQIRRGRHQIVDRRPFCQIVRPLMNIKLNGLLFLVIKDKLNRTAYGPTCSMCCQFGLIDGPCHLFTKHRQIYWSIKLHYVIYNQTLKFRYRQREGERERARINL